MSSSATALTSPSWYIATLPSLAFSLINSVEKRSSFTSASASSTGTSTNSTLTSFFAIPLITSSRAGNSSAETCSTWKPSSSATASPSRIPLNSCFNAAFNINAESLRNASKPSCESRSIFLTDPSGDITAT